MSKKRPDSRQFKLRQPLYGAFIIFGFTSCAPFLAALLWGNGFRLSCQRLNAIEGSCEIVVESFFKQKRVSFELSELVPSKIERRKSESGEDCYLPTVAVKEGASLRVFRMIPGICSELEANQVTGKINYFISSPKEDRLDLHRGTWKEILLYSSPLFLTGLLMSALVARDSFSTYLFDLDQSCFTITRKRWFRTVKTENYPLCEIDSIHVKTQDTGMATESKVVIKLKSAKEIELPQGNYNSHKLASDLRHFLD